MTDLSELFWQASLAEMKQGWRFDQTAEEYICLICGDRFADGQIFPSGGSYYEARKFLPIHIQELHQSVFHFLMNLDKNLTGLTDHQKTLLTLFYEGQNDNEVAKKLQIGSTSTVRNHRFALREKQKQAKVFLAIMEILAEHIPKKQTFIDIPRNTQHVDSRFAITAQESEKILSAHFLQGLDGPLAVYPLKEKKRVAILRHLVTRFEPAKNYKEKEVNEILKTAYADYAILRRHLIEYGFMNRTPDGSSYWLVG